MVVYIYLIPVTRFFKLQHTLKVDLLNIKERTKLFLLSFKSLVSWQTLLDAIFLCRAVLASNRKF